MQLSIEIDCIALLILTTLMGVVVILYFYSLFQSLKTLKWLRTEGELIDFYIGESDGDFDTGHIYTPYVRYRYTVNGLTHISDKLGFGLCGLSIASISERSLAQAFIKPLSVYYDPSDISSAVLIRGFTFHHFLCLLSTIVMFVIVLYLCDINFK